MVSPFPWSPAPPPLQPLLTPTNLPLIGGYNLWRAGFALAAAGPVWGSIIALFFGYDFATRGVPVLDAYCSKRYGEAWQRYRREVRWRLIPGVY